MLTFSLDSYNEVSKCVTWLNIHLNKTIFLISSEIIKKNIQNNKHVFDLQTFRNLFRILGLNIYETKFKQWKQCEQAKNKGMSLSRVEKKSSRVYIFPFVHKQTNSSHYQ